VIAGVPKGLFGDRFNSAWYGGDGTLYKTKIFELLTKTLSDFQERRETDQIEKRDDQRREAQ
jgi:hypothetical protein